MRTLLRNRPILYDFTKSVSRKLGNRTELYRLLSSELEKIYPFTFFQAGTNDGISHDPFREFILWRKTRGILVEPVPFFFGKLRENYRRKQYGLFFENCAVSYPASTVSFFTLDPKFLKTVPYDPTLWGVAGMSREHIRNFLPDDEWNDRIIEVKVPALTVEDMMQKNKLNSIDCLFLDIEGHEPNLLLNMDFEIVKPRVIVYEHLFLCDQRENVEARLHTNGFALRECDRDTVAVREQ